MPDLKSFGSTKPEDSGEAIQPPTGGAVSVSKMSSFASSAKPPSD